MFFWVSVESHINPEGHSENHAASVEQYSLLADTY